jgi:hypothetical protein
MPELRANQPEGWAESRKVQPWGSGGGELWTLSPEGRA